MKNRIMVIGAGILGGFLLDMLMRMNPQHQIIVAGRNISRLRERANLANLVAVQLGHEPDVSYARLDLMNIDKTAEVIAKVKPDIIFNATTLMSYWVPTKLPKEVWNKLYYAYTGWQVPMHLTLTHKLMQAVQQSSHSVRVINGSYPDVTNAALNKIGLAPEIGIGNVANVIPAIRKSVSVKLSQPLEKIQVRLIAHHYFSYKIPATGDPTGLPFHINIFLDGTNITEEMDLKTLFNLLPTKFKRTRGLEGMNMTAASALTVIKAMANQTGEVVHAPGPNGLPGGYPIKITETGLNIILPEEITLKEAVKINEEGQVLDGVQNIDEDGTIYFTDHEMSIVKNIFGYECLRMPIHECEYWAQELKEKYSGFVKNITDIQYA